jgi:hypothetical protein
VTLPASGRTNLVMMHFKFAKGMRYEQALPEGGQSLPERLK